MKCYNLPSPGAGGNPPGCRGLIFDMDGTLYTHGEYLRGQIDRIIEQFGKLRGMGFAEAREAIESYQNQWSAANGGKKTSLGYTLAALGVSPAESIRWREEFIEPGLYLREDARLRETLDWLSGFCALAVVTNNPVLVARKTLACLGVEEYFPFIIGLDTCGVSKPHEAPFRRAVELLRVPAEACISVGDRYDMDIAPPLELGMGGIVVDGVEDVYQLPRLLFPGKQP